MEDKENEFLNAIGLTAKLLSKTEAELERIITTAKISGVSESIIKILELALEHKREVKDGK